MCPCLSSRAIPVNTPKDPWTPAGMTAALLQGPQGPRAPGLPRETARLAVSPECPGGSSNLSGLATRPTSPRAHWRACCRDLLLKHVSFASARKSSQAQSSSVKPSQAVQASSQLFLHVCLFNQGWVGLTNPASRAAVDEETRR